MKFEVGDKVWIPTREKLVQKFGLYADGSIGTSPGIAGVMNQFCGQKVTIAKVLYSGSYRIEEDGHRFFWPGEIFERCADNGIIKNRSTSLAIYLHRKKGTPLEFIEDDSDKIHIGNYVEIVDTGATYDYYRDWIKTHCPEFENDFKEGEVPPLGAIGRVVGKGEHLNRENMLYGVYIEENDRFLPNAKNRVFCIDESGIKKLKPYRISN